MITRLAKWWLCRGNKFIVIDRRDVGWMSVIRFGLSRPRPIDTPHR